MRKYFPMHEAIREGLEERLEREARDDDKWFYDPEDPQDLEVVIDMIPGMREALNRLRDGGVVPFSGEKVEPKDFSKEAADRVTEIGLEAGLDD